MIYYYCQSNYLRITGKLDIYTMFALYKPYILKGELYRLISCGFLHADIIHLICNMYSLSIIGSQIESFIGKTKYLMVYFISMLTGSLLSVLIAHVYSLPATTSFTLVKIL